MTIAGDVDGSSTYTGLRFGYNAGANSYLKGAIVYEGLDGYVRGKIHLSLDNAGDDGNVEAINHTKLTVQYNGNVGIGTTVPGGEIRNCWW